MAVKYGWLDHEVVWARYAEGHGPAQIGRMLRRLPDAIYALIYKAGGISPRPGRGRRSNCRWSTARRSPAAWLQASRCGALPAG